MWIKERVYRQPLATGLSTIYCTVLTIVYFFFIVIPKQVESFLLEQEDLDNPVLKTASELLLSRAADNLDLRRVDPETQARLEALLEAAGEGGSF